VVYKRLQATLDTADIHTILNTDLSTIIAGDLNAKNTVWNSMTTNAAGFALDRYIGSKTDCTAIDPNSPTHYPDNHNHTPDVLDMAIMKTGRMQYELENLPNELSSDHTAIILYLQTQRSRIIPPRQLRIIDWSKFESDFMEATQASRNCRTKE